MTVPILHFSDVLCIYAYIAQVRLAELERTFGDDVAVDFHFCQVFDDTAEKLARGWGERGGFDGYAAHVESVARRYEHVRLHEKVWRGVRPRTSLTAHLFLRAVGELEQLGEVAPGSLERALEATRRAFFEEARDVARPSELWAVAELLQLPRGALEEVFDSGVAQAALARDVTLSRRLDVRVSPTLSLNEGRQRLEGNVGFRIIEANVRELIRSPVQEASWC